MAIWRRDEQQQLTPDLFEAIRKLAPPPHIQLYQLAGLDKLKRQAHLAKDRDEIASTAKLITGLTERGFMRKLKTVSSTYKSDLLNLAERFPNFSEVINYVHRCAEIAWRTDKVLRLTPILLSGDAGVGKTVFSEALGAWMDHGFHRISISSSQNGSELSGSSTFWSNSKPGIPFTALTESDYANPLIFIDEIDKNSTSQYDALGALYVLLEPTTAKNYADQSVPLPLDCSHINWIACCNYLDLVPAPIKSRFKCFNITITEAQTRKIAQAIVRAKLAELMPATDGMTVSEAAMNALATMSPRKIGHAITDAIGDSLIKNTTLIEVVEAETPKRRMGFLP